jgi:ABC-2 type transport system ATP-binding protein
VDHLDLEVKTGEIFGILGPNGAGKTTTLEMMEGLREPDEGSIRVAGIDAVADPDAVRRVIGVQLQTTALFPFLSGAELIELFASLYDVDSSQARIDELLKTVDLSDKRGNRVDQLSGGQQQRLSITLALVNNPKVVFLDEPTTGLDPGARRDLWKTVQDVRAAGATVVLTTHYMEEAEVLCDRVAIMNAGKIIALGTPAGLIRELGASATIRARIAAGSLDRAIVEALPAAAGATFEGDRIEVKTTNVQQTLVGLLDAATRAGVTLDDLGAQQATLEDVFLSLSGRKLAESETPEPVAAAPKRRRGMRG